VKLNILIVESTRTAEWRRRGGARSGTVHRTRIINAWKFRLRLLIYSTILPVYPFVILTAAYLIQPYFVYVISLSPGNFNSRFRGTPYSRDQKTLTSSAAAAELVRIPASTAGPPFACFRTGYRGFQAILAGKSSQL
jgi:hypothetical protein